MNALVICPDHRDCAGFARRMRPLALMPFWGRELLDLWLEHLAARDVTHVVILAADRPDEIRRAVEQGGRWGLQVTVTAVPTEPTEQAARAQFMTGDSAQWLSEIITLDTLPELPGQRLWDATDSLFGLMVARFRNLPLDSRLTMQRIAPDVFVSTRARIASNATIEGPAWIGPQVIVAEHAQILPGTIIEEAAYIDHHATVRGSWIGPKTYIGAMTEVSHSFVWGNGIENWRIASFLEVTDEFLIASLKRQPYGAASIRWLTRLVALALLLLTAPVALLCMAWSRLVKQRPALTERMVVLPSVRRSGRHTASTPLHALTGVGGLFSRWPELWRVWCGEMALVGNRPLCPGRAVMLSDEFEKLWLGAPAGVFSLADATDDGLDDPESSLAHAACYTVRSSRLMNARILLRCLPRFLTLRSSCNAAAKPSAQPQPCP